MSRRKSNVLYDLIEVQEAIDNCDMEGSRLCDNCPSTDYGCGKPYSSHPVHGFVSCEGCDCDIAEDNVHEEVMGEFYDRKEELKLKDAKMKFEVDLDILQANLLKMSLDEIEEGVTATLVHKLSEKMSATIEEKVNTMLREKMDKITQSQLFNIKISKDGKEISLFEHLVKDMIVKSQQLNADFEKTIEELTNSAKYHRVSEEYNDDEFKVLTTISQGEYDSVDGISITVNGVEELSLWEGEPEDMTFNRDLSGALDIPDLIKLAYLAGKNGKTMYMAEEIEKE